MVTDRKITVSNGRKIIELTAPPYYVKKINGFDMLDVNIVTSQGFGQEGTSYVNAYTYERSLLIEGQIRASSTREMQVLRDSLSGIFLPKTELVITHFYGGVTRRIKVYVEKTPAFSFSNIGTIQFYNVEMTAPDPFWYADNYCLVEMANTAGNFHFPLTIPKEKGVVFGVKSNSMIAQLANRSPVKLPLKIIFTSKGNVSNPYILNVNTRECIKLNCNMQDGQTIIIETGEDKTVTSRIGNTVEDYIGYVDIAGESCTFLELDVGDNVMRYGADDGEEYLAVKFTYYDKYMGV